MAEQIRVINLSKSFGVREVFKQVSFEIKQGERVGLVGPNGAGKSTLMHCLLGMEEYDEGNIVMDEALTIGYLQQDVNLGDESLEEEIQKAFSDVQKLEEQFKELTTKLEHEEASEKDLKRLAYLQERLEWLGGYDYEARSRRIAYGLGFNDEDLTKKASEFSGGQKTRINLAKALVRQPDFLFLDEPTNHLDMDMLDWLESYLNAYKGGILVVSHDRYFLDKIVTSVIELDHHKVHTYKGNYSRYLEQRAARYKAEKRAYDKQQEHIKKTEEYINKYRAGIKSKMARGRQSQLDRLERLEAPETSHTFKFTFPPAAMSADKVLVLDDVSVGYDHTPIMEHISGEIRRGEVVALLGANGAGKSTLVKAIAGEMDVLAGHIVIGNRVQLGYFSQEHEELHDHWTLIDEVMMPYDFSEEKARNVLGAFLFRGDDVFKLVGDLSGGERARLSLLQLFLQGNNFLILDEPTNHLDIPTREIVEEALREFEGTTFVISHDRYFLDAVAKRILWLNDGKIEEFMGNYSYFREKIHERETLAALAAAEAEANQSSIKASESKQVVEPDHGVHQTGVTEVNEAPKKPNSYMKEKQLEQVESEIARLEATVKMYNAQLMAVMSDPTETERLANELNKVNEELEDLYEKWEFLSEE